MGNSLPYQSIECEEFTRGAGDDDAGIWSSVKGVCGNVKARAQLRWGVRQEARRQRGRNSL